MELTKIVEWTAQGLENLGVAVIAFAFIHALTRAALHVTQKRPDAYERLKHYLGKALMLGLEFLVAADIIRTVTVKPTLDGLMALGLLVVLRIVLGWSIAVELDGCWPWRVKEENRRSDQ
jgi:uncharacterized membrane protein